MPARRLLVLATLVSSVLVAACSSNPTGIDDVTPATADTLALRKDQIPWH